MHAVELRRLNGPCEDPQRGDRKNGGDRKQERGNNRKAEQHRDNCGPCRQNSSVQQSWPSWPKPQERRKPTPVESPNSRNKEAPRGKHEQVLIQRVWKCRRRSKKRDVDRRSKIDKQRCKKRARGSDHDRPPCFLLARCVGCRWSAMLRDSEKKSRNAASSEDAESGNSHRHCQPVTFAAQRRATPAVHSPKLHHPREIANDDRIPILESE